MFFELYKDLREQNLSLIYSFSRNHTKYKNSFYSESCQRHVLHFCRSWMPKDQAFRGTVKERNEKGMNPLFQKELN